MTNKVDGRIWGEGPEEKEMEREKEGQCSSRMVRRGAPGHGGSVWPERSRLDRGDCESGR